MSLFNRYLKHPTAGTGGLSTAVDAPEALDAGRMTVLGNNALHMCEQNPIRALRQHPGFREFYAASATPGFTGTPEQQDIPWATSIKDGAAWADLGTHFVWRLPSGQWPRISLTLSFAVDGSNSAGVLLALAPGVGGPFDGRAVGAVTTSSSYGSTTLSIDLEDADLGDLPVVPMNGILEASIAERGTLKAFRAFFGAYCSSGTNTAGQRANAVGLSLYTESR
jgi:hypothetical protein